METFDHLDHAGDPGCSDAGPQEYPFTEYIPEEPAESFVQPDQPQAEPFAAETYYHGAGKGRKESPFADSPYERAAQPQQQYRYEPQRTPPQKPKKEKKPAKPVWKGILAAVLAVAVVAGSCAFTASVVNEHWEERHEDAVEMLTGQIQDLQRQINELPAAAVAGSSAAPGVTGPVAAGEFMTPGELYSRCVGSVVAISATVPSTTYYGSYGESRGSGFIMAEDGYILTNYHVVEEAVSITVTTYDGTEYQAECVGYDSSANDLAVLKVEASGLQAAKIGSSSDLSIGEMVAAIGNPLGELTSTQTVGYVSGMGREVATDSLTTIRMIQTDAAINPGNSGGPLFNMRGEVIGITTAKYSGTTTSGATIEGIGFAIPIDDVMNVIDDLIEFGYVTGAYMGVSVQNTDEESAAMFGLPTGAYIVSVEKGGAAERAGIQPKDIVIRVGEYDVSNVTDLTRALRNFKAGDTTTVTVIRGGTEVELEITLDAKPQETSPVPTPPEEDMPSGNFEEWYDYFRRHFGG